MEDIKITIVEPRADLITPVSHIADYEKLIEIAGRTCYKSEDRVDAESHKRFIRSIIKRGHESVVEHCSVTYRFACSRAASHQLVRHRLGAYCIDGEALTETTISGTTHKGKKFRHIKHRTIKQLFNMKQTSHGRSRLKLVQINCLDESTGQIVKGKIANVVYSGKKSCFEIEINNGKYKIKATKDHQFLTSQGWMRLEEIIQQQLPIAVNGLRMPSRGWLIKEYLTKNRMRTDIAMELGISDSWLGRYIAKLNIKKSHRSYPNRHGGSGKKGMHSEEGRRCISIRMSGDKNHRWKGGITPERQRLQKEISTELRQQIYKRDDFTCRLCYRRGGTLELHHIIPCYQDKTLFFEPTNLVTICADCHRTKINNHEHEYQDYFHSLTPIQPRPATQKIIEQTVAHFMPITKVEEVGEIDTYDIEMEGPNHNFVANGIVVHNSQESQRFCDYGRLGFQVIMPPSIKDDSIQSVEFINFCTEAYRMYCNARSKGIPPEDARFYLPNASKTEIVTTFNLRQWRHVLNERLINPHAQWEIKSLMNAVAYELNSYIPIFFEDIIEKLSK